VQVSKALEAKKTMKEITPYLIRIAGLAMIVFATTKFPMYYFAYLGQLENSFFVYFLPVFIQLFVAIIFFAFPTIIGKSSIKTT